MSSRALDLSLTNIDHCENATSSYDSIYSSYCFLLSVCKTALNETLIKEKSMVESFGEQWDIRKDSGPKMSSVL